MPNLLRVITSLQIKERYRRNRAGDVVPTGEGKRDSRIQIAKETPLPLPLRAAQAPPPSESLLESSSARRYEPASNLPKYEYTKFPGLTSVRVVELLPGRGKTK
jgi:hypothetical protein